MKTQKRYSPEVRGRVVRGRKFKTTVVNVFAGRMVGWRAPGSLCSDIALDALDEALYDRGCGDGLVHHGGRGVQYVSIRYTERLAEAEKLSPTRS